MSWSKENFEKQGYFYLDKRPEQGNGDLLYNTFRMIIETGDTSDWAIRAFYRALICLSQRERWPDNMSEFITTTTHKQTDMTRDPFIAGIACAVFLNKPHLIRLKALTPPWYLYRPEVWEWRRALLGKRNCYEFWRAINSMFPKKEYVKALDRLMWDAYVTMKNR